MDCVVYWLFDERCTCPWRHGYVGISANYDHRMGQHRSAKPFQWKSKVLFTGTVAECCALEFQLRPRRHIGWNIGAGGGKPRLGIRDALTTRQAKSIARRRFLASPRAAEALRIAAANSSRTQKGRTITWGDKIAATLTGHVRTMESRAKQSASTKDIPKTAPQREKMADTASARYADRKPRSESYERQRLAKNAKRAARRAAGLPRLY